MVPQAAHPAHLSVTRASVVQKAQLQGIRDIDEPRGAALGLKR